MQTSLQLAVKITERYRDLQGLRLVAGGAGLLVVFVVTMILPLSLAEARARGGLGELEWAAVALAVDLIAMVVSIKALGAWYERRFGRVDMTRRQRRLTGLVGGLGAVSFLAPFEVEIVANNAGWTLPINVILVGLSIGIVAYWLYLGRAFVHYLVIAGFGFGLVALSIAGVPPNGFGAHVREAILFAAVASILAGLVDHRILLSALGARKPVGVDS